MHDKELYLSDFFLSICLGASYIPSSMDSAHTFTYTSCIILFDYIKFLVSCTPTIVPLFHIYIYTVYMSFKTNNMLINILVGILLNFSFILYFFPYIIYLKNPSYPYTPQY